MSTRLAWPRLVPMLAALALTIGACSSSQTTAPETSAPGTSAVRPLPTTQVDAYRAVVTDTMAQMKIPGAVVVVRTPEGTWSQAFGTRRLGANDPVTVADHFRIGSNTKTMTGTVVLQLVQEGKLALDDPVSKYLPDVPNGQNITIAQLLDMRSGLFNYSELLSFNQSLDEDPTRVWKPEELAALGLGQPPYFPPGAGFHYSNTNTILLGLVIEKLTGTDLRTQLSQRIFGPLHLSDTSFPAPDDAAIPAPHPNGYMFGTNVSTYQTAALPPDQQAAAMAGTLQPNDVTAASPSWTWAAGEAISTADDLATYVEALVGSDTLLDTQLQDQRLASVQPIDPAKPDSPGYGLALASFGPMIGHDGSMPGFQTFMGHDPKTHDTLIVLCNLTDGPAGQGGSANQIAKGIIAKLTEQ